ncbi:MAG: DoxX family protein [Acidobacteria bacterium]|nr:MAG: DoxX family protein [Acidobacteriota bacterium]
MRELKIYLIDSAPYVLSVLRIVAGFLFLQHGTQKLFGYPMRPPGGKPALGSLFGVAGLLEFIGGILIMIGLFTRPVAFILSGEMAVAYLMIHAPQGFWPTKNQGETAVFYCFLFLFFVFSGPGPWSVDALLGIRSI